MNFTQFGTFLYNLQEIFPVKVGKFVASIVKILASIRQKYGMLFAYKPKPFLLQRG